jgi:hypothetical protein
LITKKDVFAKRREGAIDEAYQMALQLIGTPKVSDWDFKALAWCLIDLVKRDVEAENRQNLAHYRQQLEAIKIDPKYAVLLNSTRNALLLCNPQGKLINDAKTLSKLGQHADAANIYRKVWSSGTADVETQNSLGWELYRHAKQLMALDNIDLGAVKRNLNDYFKLDVEKPSLLHTCVLQIASKLAGGEGFNMLAFSRLWNLDCLRREDFDRYHGEDGKAYPSLAEKVIQQAGKDAVGSGKAQDLNYILPHIDSAIEKFSDNVWLKHNKAKVLLALGKRDEALEFGIAVAKSKVHDYWAWELLGDIHVGIDAEAVLSCYCKALTCSSEDLYTCNLRLKLAQRMVEVNALAASKYEVARVIAYRDKLGQKIPRDALKISSDTWYAQTQANLSNMDYYVANASSAEALLFNALPWIDANVGEEFTVAAKDGRKARRMRKLFIQSSSLPFTVNISESKFTCANLAVGDGIRIKGEFDCNKRFQIYLIGNRASDKPWDVFIEKIGVVDRVNKDTNEIHFIVDHDINGVVRACELTDAFKEGDAIAVKLFTRTTSENRLVYCALHAAATAQVPSALIKKTFCEPVRVSDGMGFTSNNIFIPPPLVSANQVKDGQKLSGAAVASYNKKRASWGWKAISIEYGCP